MHTEFHSRLTAIHTTQEYRDRNIPYRFLVQQYHGAHTAFMTRYGFDLWMAERGLALGDNIDAEGSWVAIVGTYSSTSHMDASEFYAQAGELTRVLSNGDYTLGIITTDDAGHKTVHSLNPNVHSRPVFDYKTSKEIMK